MTASSAEPREAFDLAGAAHAEFSFLTDYGLELVEQGPLSVRYQSSRRLVDISHGRLDYIVGVEVGRWIDAHGVLTEEASVLEVVVAALAGDEEPEKMQAATTPEQLSRQLHRLAQVLRPLAPALLGNGDASFDRIREYSSAYSTASYEKGRATYLRSRADEAWHRKDFEAVIAVYGEITRELSTVTLSESERARLAYAHKQAQH
jgi:hypothetical protein